MMVILKSYEALFTVIDGSYKYSAQIIKLDKVMWEKLLSVYEEMSDISITLIQKSFVVMLWIKMII